MAEEKEPAVDLFDRWLSHREQSGRLRDDAQPEAGSQAQQPQPAHQPEPDPEPGAPADAAPVADEPEVSPPVDDQPGVPGPAPRPAPTAPDRSGVPVDFEPVIIPSARRKKPEPRLGRRRPRFEPADEPAAGPAREEVRAEVERVRAEERAAAARRAEEAEEAERLLRAEEARLEAEARIAAQLEAARLAEDERLAAAEAERLAAEARAEAARLAEEKRLAAEAEAARIAEVQRAEQERRAEQDRRAERARLEAEARIAAQLEAARQAEAAERQQAEPDPKVDSVSASRDVLAALAEPAPVAKHTTKPTTKPATKPATKTAEAAPAARTRPAKQATPSRTVLEQPDAARAVVATWPEPGVSTNVEFTPRTGTRRLVGLLLLLALVSTGGASYIAYQERTTFAVGTAVALGVLTLIIWAVRAGSATARLSVRGGQLEVLRGGGRFVFDLASSYTPIEVVGRPGDRGWTVLFLRRSMAPFVVDASMVDPEEFMAVLRQYRPEPPN